MLTRQPRCFDGENLAECLEDDYVLVLNGRYWRVDGVDWKPFCCG